MEPLSDSIYVVAVDTNPILWVVHCELCDDEFGEPTQDENLIESLEAEHYALHGIQSET